MDLSTALMYQRISELLCTDEKFKAHLVDSLNKNVDIPFINESTEETIIKAIIDTVGSVLKSSADDAVQNACNEKLKNDKNKLK